MNIIPIKEIFDFVVIDIETTGLDKKYDQIIEIGAIKYIKGEKTEEFSVFIKPTKEIPTFIKQLTHISDDDLKKGIDIKEALAELSVFAKKFPLVCHNTSFDIPFINEKCAENSLPLFYNKTYDTLEISKIFLPYLNNHKLESVTRFFKLENIQSHRAIYDAKVTGEIFIHLIEYISEYTSIEQINLLYHIAEYAGLENDLGDFLRIIIEYKRKYALLKKNTERVISPFYNYIEHKPESKSTFDIDECFSDDGFFASQIDNYEIREGQIEMSHEILEAFLNNKILMVEAGTGVGKSLAYLVSALKFHNLSDSKIIISTNTKNLQEQLFYKDIPDLKNAVPAPFKAVILKGRENYLCEKKWLDITLNFEANLSKFEARQLLYLVIWRDTTISGEISENSSFSRNNGCWRKVCADRYFCSGRKCPYYRKCFLMNIRKKAEEASFIVVNHSLLLSDIANENLTLGEYDYLIIDEAHNLPDQAASFMGFSLSYTEINNFFNSLFHRGTTYQQGLISKIRSDLMKSGATEHEKEIIIQRLKEIESLLDEKKSFIADIFIKAAKLVSEKGDYNKFRIRNEKDFPEIKENYKSILTFWEDLSQMLDRLKAMISEIGKLKFPNFDNYIENLEASSLKIEDYFNIFAKLKDQYISESAFWLSVIGDGSNTEKPLGVINYAPLNINEILADILYPAKKSIIFTSATLSIRGLFRYFMSRMGLDLIEEQNRIIEKIVPSPFDYDRNTSVVLSGFLPSPTDSYHKLQAFRLLKETLEKIRVGTMILFTSYRDLDDFYDYCAEDFYKKNIMLLAQGKGAGRSAIVNEFKNNGKAVLLGTSSFWEGVDIQGDSLQLLIIFKLPFQVPSEPIVQAYQEKLEAENKNSFMHYMLPNALLKYRQGFGRLIRSKKDSGVFWILDNRIHTKKYGQYFKEIIPTKTINVTTSLENFDYIAEWFKITSKF